MLHQEGGRLLQRDFSRLLLRRIRQRINMKGPAQERFLSRPSFPSHVRTVSSLLDVSMEVIAC